MIAATVVALAADALSGTVAVPAGAAAFESSPVGWASMTGGTTGGNHAGGQLVGEGDRHRRDRRGQDLTGTA